MMSLQMAGQNTFFGIGTLEAGDFLLAPAQGDYRCAAGLPPAANWRPGRDGVFLSEPISDVIGGSACFITMMCTVWRELVAKEKAARESLPETGADTELPKKT